MNFNSTPHNTHAQHKQWLQIQNINNESSNSQVELITTYRKNDGRRRRCWAYAAERPGFKIRESAFDICVVLETGNPGCAARIKRAASRRTSRWKWIDLKEGTTNNTMATLTILSRVCTALERTPVNLVVQYGPCQNMESTTCLQPMDFNLCDPRSDLWTTRFWLHVLAGTMLHHKMHRLVIYDSANSWQYCMSYHRIICGALLQICPLPLLLPTRCPPRRDALDMRVTARITCLEHNTYINAQWRLPETKLVSTQEKSEIAIALRFSKHYAQT